MYVCICHEVTERDIKQAVKEGASSVEDLRNKLHVASSCGRCEEFAESCIRAAENTVPLTQKNWLGSCRAENGERFVNPDIR